MIPELQCAFPKQKFYVLRYLFKKNHPMNIRYCFCYYRWSCFFPIRSNALLCSNAASVCIKINRMSKVVFVIPLLPQQNVGPVSLPSQRICPVRMLINRAEAPPPANDTPKSAARNSLLSSCFTVNPSSFRLAMPS